MLEFPGLNSPGLWITQASGQSQRNAAKE